MAISNDRLLEGLYGLGVDINTLRSVDKNLPPDTFRQLLENAGIKPVDFQRAEAVVNLRTGGGTLTEKVRQVLMAMGATSDGISRAEKEIGGNSDPKAVLGVLTNIFGEQRAGNIMIKVTGVKPPAGTIWNPYRGDAPPPNADVRYGSLGSMTAPGPGMAPEGSVHHTLQRGGERTDAKPLAGGNLPQPLPSAGGAGAGRAPGAVTRAGTNVALTDGTPALGAGASDEAVRAYVKKHYAQYAWMLDVPDIANVMRLAAEKGWETEEVTGAMVATDWWKKTEPAARQWIEQTLIDPANTRDQIAKQVTTFRNQALSLGINIPDAELNRLAEESLKFAWDENEQRAALGQFYKYDEKNLLGAAQATSNHLKQAARDWMVPLDSTTLATWTEKVIRGEATTDYFDTYLAGQAKSLYPQLEDPISRGINPSQWMAPYRSIAAETLGLNPDEMDLRDPKWMRSINQVDEKGGRKPMTLYDWENLLKTDDQYGWDKTQQGRDHGASLARDIAAQFGFASGGGM